MHHAIEYVNVYGEGLCNSHLTSLLSLVHGQQ